MFNLNMDILIFLKEFIALLVAAAVLIKTSQNIFLEKHKGNLVKKIKSRKEFPQGKDDNDDKNKSRWERFKDWCSRNKVYIGVAILATVAAVTAYVVYSSGAKTPDVSPPNPGNEGVGWKEKAGLDRLEWASSSIDFLNKKNIAQVCLEFLGDETFFSPRTRISSITGADILVKEGLFLKQMLVVLDYYRENPPEDLPTRIRLDTLTDFLKYNLRILGEIDQYQFYKIDEMRDCVKAYGYYLANWDEAPITFKTLFNFLTRSPTEGAHQEPIEAFRKLSTDFVSTNLTKSLDL